MLPRRRRAAAVAAVIALAVPARALAEGEQEVPPPWRFSSAPTCTVIPGASTPDVTIALPPGYYLADSAWDKLDLELHRLQEQETRLTAENEVFRKHARAGSLGWRGGLLIAGTAFAAGMAAALITLR
jgi:hypothetical protein